MNSDSLHMNSESFYLNFSQFGQIGLRTNVELDPIFGSL